MTRIPRMDDAQEPEELEPGSADEKSLTTEIDDWLAANRPDGYDGDFAWHDAFMDHGLSRLREIEPDTRDRDYLRRLIRTREGIQARNAKMALIKVTETDQLPLELTTDELRQDILRWPLIIEGQRRRFGAVTAADLNRWLLESARVSDARNATEAKMREGATRLMNLLNAQGLQRIEDLRPDDGEEG